MDRARFLASKGTPHTVILALMVEGPQSTSALADYVAMDERTVGKSLALLEGLGIVGRNESGRWALLAATTSTGSASVDAESEASTGSASVDRNALRKDDYTVRRSSSSVYSTIPELTEKKKKNAQSAQSVHDRQKVWRLLVDAGVGRQSPALSRLLEMSLDPGYVESHVKHNRKLGTPVSYLIQRLQSGDPAPVDREVESRRYVQELEALGVIQR